MDNFKPGIVMADSAFAPDIQIRTGQDELHYTVILSVSMRKLNGENDKDKLRQALDMAGNLVEISMDEG